MMQNPVAFDRLSATGFCTAHVIDLVTAIFCRTDVRLRNTPCLGRFERYRLTGPCKLQHPRTGGSSMSFGDPELTPRPACVPIPGEVARDSGMISPTIPI
jgi:hypothetical protein